MNGTTLFAAWFKNARHNLNLTQTQLAKKLGVNPQTISNWENELCFPPRNKLSRIAKTFSISEMDVLRVKTQSEFQLCKDEIEKLGTPIIPYPGQDVKKLAETITQKSPWKEGFIPEINAYFKGDPDNLIDKVEAWEGKWLNQQLIPHRMFAFRLSDNSMEPYFHQNTVIICEKLGRMPKGPQKVVVKLKNRKETLFRIYEERGNQITLRPLNPAFPATPIKKEDIHRLYLAVKSIFEMQEL